MNNSRNHRWSIEAVFWISLLLVVLPVAVLFVAENRLKKLVQANPLSPDWSLMDENHEILQKLPSLPMDLRKNHAISNKKHWIFQKTVATSTIANLDEPILIAGRIGDSDLAKLNHCVIGTTGLNENKKQAGWWWGALRVYRMPKECLLPNEAQQTIEIEVLKWGGPSYGVYGGPIALGNAPQVLKLTKLIEWLRFSVLGLFGVFLIGVSLYYALVYLLVTARIHNGIFALCAFSVGVFEIVTSAIPYRQLSTDGSFTMRINLYSALLIASTLLWFLYVRFQAISKWMLRASIVGGLLAFAASLFTYSLDGAYKIYESWFGFFLLTIFISYGQFLLFFLRRQQPDLWRYLIGFSAFIAAASHDIVVTQQGLGNPYLVPYGFVFFAVAVTFTLAKEYGDAFLHVEAQVADRTKDLANAMNELRGLQKMKERFFANVSHDFKTPIAVALGTLDEVKTKAKNGIGAALAPAERNLRKLLDLITQMLDTVKAESGTLKLQWQKARPANLLRQWAESYQVLCNQKGLQFEILTQGYEGLQVPMDIAKMERVIDNLLSNAVKFTDRRQDPSRRNAGQGVVRVELRTDEARMYIEVSDSGIGVPKEERDKIFDRYFQSSRTSLKEHGGSGIGLSFAKEMLELHQGKIWVEESEFGGSKFVVALPLSQDVEMVGEYVEEQKSALKGSLDVPYPPATPLKLDPFKPSILVVEDNPEVSQVVTRALAERYNIYFAPNGKKALQALETIRVDCIVSDIQMPEMNGTELLQALRQDARYKTIPVIMLTSRSEEEDVIGHLQMGAQDYVAKPFKKDILLARVSAQTETVRLRESLLHSERMAAVGTLTAGICHEIRNPLNNIGAVTLRMSGELNPEQTTEYAKTISRNVSRADRIVKDLLGFSRKDDGVMKTVNLRELIQQTMDFLGDETRQRVEISVDLPERLEVPAHPNQIQQVFLNIFLNSVQAIPGKGRIKIESAREGETVKVLFTDNGDGMPEEVQKQIFTPFFTTKDQGKGTGLGLYLAYQIMQRHNGFIQVASAPEKGTTVTLGFRLPVKEGKAFTEATV